MKVMQVTPMLGVADVDRSVAFYREALGFEVTGEFTPEGSPKRSWANLDNGDAALMVTTFGVGDGEHAAGHGDLVLYLETVDLEAEHAKLRKAGFDVSDLRVMFYQHRECDLTDPDGYRITLGERTDDPPTVTE